MYVCVYVCVCVCVCVCRPMPRMSHDKVTAGLATSRRGTADSIAAARVASPASPGPAPPPPHSPTARVGAVLPAFTASADAGHMSAATHALAGRLADVAAARPGPLGPQSTCDDATQTAAPSVKASRTLFVPPATDCYSTDQVSKTTRSLPYEAVASIVRCVLSKASHMSCATFARECLGRAQNA